MLTAPQGNVTHALLFHSIALFITHTLTSIKALLFLCCSRGSYFIRTCLVILTLSWVLTVAQGAAAEENPDPWEPLNRKVFVFNEKFDIYFLKPAARTYMAITPSPLQIGLDNFLKNTENLVIGTNDLLQLKWVAAGQDFLRFGVNLTLGFFGLFDVASHLHIPTNDEDFGQTLGYWGVPDGPYVMLPFLGASTLRDAFARTLVDSRLDIPPYVDHIQTRNTYYWLWALDLRVELFEYEEIIIGDPYVFIRDAYMQTREFRVKDGKVEDDFLNDSW